MARSRTNANKFSKHNREYMRTKKLEATKTYRKKKGEKDFGKEK